MDSEPNVAAVVKPTELGSGFEQVLGVQMELFLEINRDTFNVYEVDILHIEDPFRSHRTAQLGAVL